MNGVIRVKMNNEDNKTQRYIRKVGRMGNSLGIGLPKSLTEKLKLMQGDEVELTLNSEGDYVLRKAPQTKLPDQVRPEVIEAFYDIFNEDREIFGDLRDR